MLINMGHKKIGFACNTTPTFVTHHCSMIWTQLLHLKSSLNLMYVWLRRMTIFFFSNLENVVYNK